jgi:hypothetical protein
MASNIGDIRSGIPPRIKDTAGKLTAVVGNGAVDLTKDVDAAIFSALEQYGKARPRERAALVTGAGALVFDYALDGGSPTLAGYIGGFSSITDILYPWSAATPNLDPLPREEYTVMCLSSGIVLRFFLARPLATEQFLVNYTTPHALDTTQSTVRASDDEALKDLAAAFACDELASFYAHSTDPNIQADAVNNMSKAGEYRAMAKEFRNAYAAKMDAAGAAADGQGGAVVPPALAIAQIQDSFYGQPSRHFFHGRQR